MFLQVHTRLLYISIDTQHSNNLRTSTLTPSICTLYIYSEYFNIPTLSIDHSIRTLEYYVLSLNYGTCVLHSVMHTALHSATMDRVHRILAGVWLKLRAYNHWIVESVCINVKFNGFWLPISSQIHMRWKWLYDRICVGYLCGLESGISLWLPEFGGSWEHTTTEMSKREI